jgi:hypothetical protein
MELFDVDLETITEKFRDAAIPGYVVSFDPEEAACAGAFQETALSEEDALESTADGLGAPEEIR